MDDIGKRFGTIVEQRLQALNTNAFAVEKAAGLPADAIRNVIRSEKRAGPTLSRVAEICAALGMELDIRIANPNGASLPEEVELADKSLGADFVSIPLRDVAIAAGHGAVDDCERVVSEMAFRKDWLTGLHIPPQKAVLARVSGDSMLPAIQAGDTVLIDTSKTEIKVRARGPKDKRPAPLYALRDGHGARLKRIERPQEDVLLLLSDNPVFPPEIVSGSKIGELGIIGRVLWWGHTNRDQK